MSESWLPQHEAPSFLKIIQEATRIKSHKGLFDWLHNDVQRFIPHDILLVAWGDFALEIIHVDIVTYFPDVRTTELEKEQLMPDLLWLFEQWTGVDRNPFQLSLTQDEFRLRLACSDCMLGRVLALMRSGVIHGIKDERGRHDCIYVALSANRQLASSATDAMELLLPYLDTALRQVAHLPWQYSDYVAENSASKPANGPEEPLSDRELEIMKWVCMGKTNSEIGQILDISFFTVKNHLQRIFRKLDVMNRAQAVLKFNQGFSVNGKQGGHRAQK